MPTRGSFVLVVGVVLGACRPELPEPCLVPHEGVWVFHSAAFGSREYSAHLVASQRDCVFELSEWQPDAEAELHGGTILEQTTVTLEGGSFWATCTGMIAEQGAMIDGDCEDGTTFHFMHVPPDDGGGGHNH